MRLTTKNLIFEIGANGGEAGFILSQKPEKAAKGADFWRLILDDGLRTEIPVRSSKQTGRVTETERGLSIAYDQLLSDYGDTYQVFFRVDIQAEGELLRFTPAVENRETAVRVNECFCPMAAFDELSGDKKEEDMLFAPDGPGTKIDNPWEFLRQTTGDYYHHDEYETYWNLKYPLASMSWFGVQSGSQFLYVARYDEKIRRCFLSARQTIHREPLNLMLTIDHFPMARPGEKLTLPSSVIGLLDGDWRRGADLYRAWADQAFYRVPDKAPWVQNMTGWQRIILRSQYGEDYFKPEDLPDMYRAGAKYGIHTLFLFAWWKEGMDRGYPDYTEPYPGAYEALKQNIRKVREMGGRVILECNCHFMDPQTEFYKKYGDEVKIININGDDSRHGFLSGGYVYCGAGELRMAEGPKVFPLACGGSKRWRDQLHSQVELMGGMDPDCLFLDCYGAHPSELCFNDKHDHGPRVDEEWVSHRKVFADAEQYCAQNDKVLATEWVTDIAASYNQFLHGCGNVDLNPGSRQYPALFRYTFPEVITTERGIRHTEGAYIKQFKWSLTMGLRLDCELHVCRTTIDREPAYAAAVAQYTEKLNEYGDFLLRGKFTVLDNSKLPDSVKRGEYFSEDGSRVLRILYNNADSPARAGEVKLQADEMRFDIFDSAEYQRLL